MSSLSDRIAQFRKMATDDPENELGHFRLGQLLMDDGRFADAVASFDRTLELSPQFSKAYQLLGDSHAKAGNPAKAIEVLTAGWKVADERGDKMPRDAMGKLLTDLGAAVPKPPAPAAGADGDDGPDTGFRCERPGCFAGKKAKPLAAAPITGPLGERIMKTICADCWDSWKKDDSIKVINELRLDLSSEFGSAEYDKYMRGFFGFEDESAKA
ncbi:MAG: Fe(2+)-trafficking protein [Fimbriiglobus sp.]